VGFRNMGAELMLVAAREEVRTWADSEDVAIGLRVGSRAERRRVDCGVVLRPSPGARRWASRALRVGRGAVPATLLRRARLYRPSMVDALLDASGFAFGDQWGPEQARQIGRLFAGYHREGKPVVLLPQAFGPFTDPEVSRSALDALSQADLIYARDDESFENVRSLRLSGPRLHRSPDFTGLLEPEPRILPEPTVAVIPNARMTDMPGSVEEQAYLEFLRSCVSAARDAGFRVLVLGQEPADLAYAQRLSGEHSTGVDTYQVRDALDGKAVLGGCTLVVSSRFHGLVSAMAQAVPAIGTSWSHKYVHLFEDYGCRDALWDVDDAHETHARMIAWLQPGPLAARRQALRERSDELKRASRVMWSEVSEFLHRGAPR
jgi:polysaccharide pyruvyl transferase WcaK-like protein